DLIVQVEVGGTPGTTSAAAPSAGRPAASGLDRASASSAGPSSHTELTLYCKAKEVRIEGEGRPIVLYDNGTQTLRTLLTDRKAYREASRKHGVRADRGDEPPGPMGPRGGKLEPKVAFEKLHPDGGEDVTRSIAEAIAIDYSLTGSMARSGGVARRGGFPGG